MTAYEVVITEALEPESDPTKLTPVARQVVWRGLAAGEDDATAKAWDRWDETYGPDAQPAQALRNVTTFAPH
jgi:ABC-type proline/glycine betaine transport system substrate-binding protein